MNIILLSTLYYPTIGGVTTYIEELMIELKKRKIPVSLICPIYKEDFDLLDDKKKQDVNFFLIDKNKKNSKNIITGFLRKISYNILSEDIYNFIKENYNEENTIVHQHDFISNLKLIKKLKKNNYKIILTNHTGETLLLKKIPIVGEYIIKKIFKFYDYIIGPSKELAFIENKWDKEKYKYFPNSIKLEDNKFLIDKKFNKIIFFCPRRWAPTKGVEYYLKAIKILKNKNYNLFEKCVFIFAGNDYSDYIEYKEKCSKIVKEIDSENIVLKGDIKDPQKMKELYLNANYTVIPSLYEAISLSALEAIREESVLICTNVGGMPDLIEHKKTGLMCEAANELALYELLLEACQMNKEEYTKIQKNASYFIRENFDYNKLIEKYIGLYKDTLLRKVQK